MDIAIRHDDRREIQFYAEVFERDGDCGKARPRLHNRKRKLAACQETGLFAVHCDEIRLRQNLQQILGLKSFNHSSEMNVRPEKKKIQNVADRLIGLKRPT